MTQNISSGHARRRGSTAGYLQGEAPQQHRSPLQKYHSGSTWRSPTTRSFILILKRRLAVGPVYAIVGDHEYADIVVPAFDDGEGLMRGYTYPVLGLRAMAECGFIITERVPEIPEPVRRSHGLEERFGPDIEFWKVTLP